MDTDDERLRVQEAGAALVTAKKGVTSQTEVPGGREEDVPARAQTEFYEALLDASRALLGGNSDVDGKYVQQQAKLPHSFSPCLHLQTGGGVLARHRCGFAFEVWNSQNIAMEWRAQLVGLRNSIPCHGVHDLVKMCHLVNLVRSNNWAYVCV